MRVKEAERGGRREGREVDERVDPLPFVLVCGATHYLIELSGFDEEMSML